MTICTLGKKALFGNIAGQSMILNEYGQVVQSVWQAIPDHFSHVNNEVFVVMPNHVHGIIVIGHNERAGFKPAPTKGYALGDIVRAFKTFSSRQINEMRKSTGAAVWQRNYYEHVIRSEEDYHEIGEYILDNPAQWEVDHDNPGNKR